MEHLTSRQLLLGGIIAALCFLHPVLFDLSDTYLGTSLVPASLGY